MRVLHFYLKKVHYQIDKNAATLCNNDESTSIQKTHVSLEEKHNSFEMNVDDEII